MPTSYESGYCFKGQLEKGRHLSKLTETTFPTTDQPRAQFNLIDSAKGRLKGRAANEHGLVTTTYVTQ